MPRKRRIKATELTVQLKQAVMRINIHRQKKIAGSKMRKKEIAELLEEGKEEMARVKTVQVIFEDYMVEVYNLMEVYCEMVVSRAKWIEMHDFCPEEVKEAVCSIVYAAPHLPGSSELIKARVMFLAMYGKDFPCECLDNCCVNPKLIARLRNSMPEDGLVHYYLTTIAKRHNVEWPIAPPSLDNHPSKENPPSTSALSDLLVHLPSVPVVNNGGDNNNNTNGHGPDFGAHGGAGGVDVGSDPGVFQSQPRSNADDLGGLLFPSVPSATTGKSMGNVSTVDSSGSPSYLAKDPFAPGGGLNFPHVPTHTSTPPPTTTTTTSSFGTPLYDDNSAALTAADDELSARLAALGRSPSVAASGTRASFGTAAPSRDSASSLTLVDANELDVLQKLTQKLKLQPSQTDTEHLSSMSVPFSSIQGNVTSSYQRLDNTLDSGALDASGHAHRGAYDDDGGGGDGDGGGSRSSLDFSNSFSCMSTGTYKTSIVLDPGSSTFKAGFAGNPLPNSIFPSVIGRPRVTDDGHSVLSDHREMYIGNDALSKSAVLHLDHPIYRGSCRDWDAMQTLYAHCFDSRQLNVDPTEHPILVCHPAYQSAREKQKTAQIMFETFGVPGLYLGLQSTLALFGASLETGVVLDVGDGCTTAVSIVQGAVQGQATQRLEIAGQDATSVMKALLMDSQSPNIALSRSIDLPTARSLKEKSAFVAENYDLALRSPPAPETYRLADGNEAVLSSERFRCMEIMFQPSLAGKAVGGIHQLVRNCVDASDVEHKSALLGSVLLAGATVATPGFESRLQSELVKLYDPSIAPEVKVSTLPEPRYAVWKGGSMLAANAGFGDLCVAKATYEELGADSISIMFPE